MFVAISRGRSAAILLLALVALVLPQVASAADPIGKFSISGRLGISGYRMDEVNDGISSSNRYLRNLASSAEWKLPDRLHSGFDFLGDVNYDITSNIRLGVVYAGTRGSTSVDYLERIEVAPRSTMLIPRVFYRLPFRPTVNMSLRAFGGAVFLSGVETTIEHERTSEADPRIEKANIKASGNGFIGGLMAEYTLGDRFSLSFEGGYRQAKATFDSGEWSIEVDDPQSDFDGDRIPNDRDLRDDSYLWGFMDLSPGQVDFDNLPEIRKDLDTDFSGFVAQLGLRVYIF